MSDTDLHVFVPADVARKTKANTFTGRIAFGLATTNDVRKPWFSSQVLNASTTPGTDHVAHSFQTIVSGDWTGDTAQSGYIPGWAFGLDVYTTTTNAAGAADGVSVITNTIETAVAAPSGSTIGSAIALQCEASFAGAPAGATVTTMTSLLVSKPKRKDGATAGTATTVYGLHVEEVNTTDLGATTAYSLKVDGGNSSFGGPVAITLADPNTIGVRLTRAPSMVSDMWQFRDPLGDLLAHVTAQGAFNTGVNVTSFEGQAQQVALGSVGGKAGITFGTGTDARVFRDASGVLKTVGALVVDSDRLNLSTAKTPASAAATGTAGDIAWDSGFVYVCTASNTWKRAAIATW